MCYVHEWSYEFETLKLNNFEYYGLPSKLIILLKLLIEDAKTLPEDNENGIYPNNVSTAV